MVSLGEHRITVWKGNEVLLQEPVGVGASGRTPTTKGLFYTIELYPVLPNQQSAYGPWAFALSGYSEVLTSFGDGGTGVLGLHGTGDPSSLGRDVSNGCIRMSNTGITKLADVAAARCADRDRRLSTRPPPLAVRPRRSMVGDGERSSRRTMGRNTTTIRPTRTRPSMISMMTPAHCWSARSSMPHTGGNSS